VGVKSTREAPLSVSVLTDQRSTPLRVVCCAGGGGGAAAGGGGLLLAFFRHGHASDSQ
jgi:hypothetical protein